MTLIFSAPISLGSRQFGLLGSRPAAQRHPGRRRRQPGLRR